MTTKYKIITAARAMNTECSNVSLCDVLLRYDSDEHNSVANSVMYGKYRGERFITEDEIFHVGTPDGLSIIEADGRIVVPSFVDLSATITSPSGGGDDIASATLSARAGGWNTVVASPRSTPCPDSIASYSQLIRQQSIWAACNVIQAAPLTLGQRGVALCDFDALCERGARIYSDGDGVYLPSEVLYAAMDELGKRDCLVILGKSDDGVAGTGKINLGQVSRMLGVAGIPPCSESIAVSRSILLSAQTDCAIHIPVVSTKASIDIVRNAKMQKIRVTCGTSPHHFSLTEDDVLFYGANTVLSPPLRSRSDKDSVIEALADGTIDCISSCHTPLTSSQKRSTVQDAVPGAVAFETTFSACVTYLLEPGHIDILQLVRLLSLNPAQIIGTSAKTPVLLDLDREVVFTRMSMSGNCYNTPFFGSAMRGAVDTIL